MKTVSSKTAILIISLLASQVSWGHARWKIGGLIPPRSLDTGLKSSPCGGKARGTTPVTLVAGSEIELEWEETVQHPGWYEFAISLENDVNFTRLLVVPDTQDNRATIPHQYKSKFTVPNVTCENCTFQMIQVMTENPAAPRNYYSCSDIRIVANPVVPPVVVMPPPVPKPDPPVVPEDFVPPAPSDSDCH